MRSPTIIAPTKRRVAAAGLALIGLMLTVHPALAGTERPPSATHTAVTELQWIATPVGPEASPVSGDFSTGSHITFLRFPAGTTTPLHTHSASYVGIVITGTSRHWLPGRPETEKHLPPGSHWSISACRLDGLVAEK